MKITMVLPFAGLQGGIRVAAIYADKLNRMGHEVTIISAPFTTPLRRKIRYLLLGRGWPRPPKKSHLDRLTVARRVLESSRPVVDSDVPDADVVIATYYPTAYAVERLSAAKGAKVFFIQGYEGVDDRENGAWKLPMHKIAISGWLKDLARREFGDEDVSHVPNSVDLEQFYTPPRGKNTAPTVGMLYATSWEKGCKVSLRALKQVFAKMPSLRLICFGAERPGWDMRLPSYAEFHYQPPQDELRRIYAQCDVWLCGSAREGFHLPPLEAMACGSPVVSTRVGCLPDIIEEGVNGYLVNVGDSENLAERVMRVLQMSEGEWKKMSEAASATASRYTWNDAADRFVQALEHAIERSRVALGQRNRDVRRETPPEPCFENNQNTLR